MSAFDKFKAMVGKPSANDEQTPNYTIVDAEPVPQEIVDDVIMRAKAEAQASEEKAQAKTRALPADQALDIPGYNKEKTDSFVTADSNDYNVGPAAKELETFDYIAPSTAPTFDKAPELHRPEVSRYVAADTPRALGPIRKTDNLAHIRTDLAQLNEDMSSGEQFYAQSLKRINNLINYAYETEANLSALEHLEPENRRLMQELEAARQKANDQMVKAESFKSKADAYESRYLDARQAMEVAQLSLTKIEAERESLSREIADKEVEIAGLVNSNRTIRNDLAVDRQTQEKLSAKNLSLSSELSVALSERLELEKRNKEFTAKIDQLNADKIELERVVASTRSAHKATEEHNIALKTEMEQVLADVQIFKQQFDQASRTNGAEINNLRAQVSDLSTEVSIKKDIVSHAHDEMAELRAKHDAAHRGRRNLLEHIEKQKLAADGLRDAHEATKSEARNYSSQIMSLQAEIDQLRRLNAMQSDKLKKYMAINAMPVSAAPAYPQRGASLASTAVTASIPAKANPAPKATSMPVKAERRSADRPFTARTESQDLPPLRDQSSDTKTTAKDICDIVSVNSDEPPAVISDAQAMREGRISSQSEQESARYGLVGGISSAHGMNSKTTDIIMPEQLKSPEPSEFDRQFADLEDAATATPASGSASAQTEAQNIEDTLQRFHEIDLLDSVTPKASNGQVA